MNQATSRAGSALPHSSKSITAVRPGLNNTCSGMKLPCPAQHALAPGTGTAASTCWNSRADCAANGSEARELVSPHLRLEQLVPDGRSAALLWSHRVELR